MVKSFQQVVDYFFHFYLFFFNRLDKKNCSCFNHFFLIVDCTNESYRNMTTVVEETSSKQTSDMLVVEQQLNRAPFTKF